MDGRRKSRRVEGEVTAARDRDCLRISVFFLYLFLDRLILIKSTASSKPPILRMAQASDPQLSGLTIGTTGAMDWYDDTAVVPKVVHCPEDLFDQAFDELDNTSTDQELADDLRDIEDGVPVEPRTCSPAVDQDAPGGEDSTAIHHNAQDAIDGQGSGEIISGEITGVTGMQILLRYLYRTPEETKHRSNLVQTKGEQSSGRVALAIARRMRRTAY